MSVVLLAFFLSLFFILFGFDYFNVGRGNFLGVELYFFILGSKNRENFK